MMRNEFFLEKSFNLLHYFDNISQFAIVKKHDPARKEPLSGKNDVIPTTIVSDMGISLSVIVSDPMKRKQNMFVDPSVTMTADDDS
jgi:hypothetical protein